MADFEDPCFKEWDFIIFIYKIKKICMEKVVGEQELALPQHFP